MPEPKDNSPELLRFPNSTGGHPSSPGSTSPEFSFGADEDSAPPEMELGGSIRSTEDAANPTPLIGIDLSGRQKIIFWVGRGKTGKTTGIRWLAEKTLMNGTPLLMADLDLSLIHI